MCLKEKKTIFVENNDRGETEAEGTAGGTREEEEEGEEEEEEEE